LIKSAIFGFNYKSDKNMKTILQVEDDPSAVVFLKHAMKKAEVPNPIQVVTDGQQALDYLRGDGRFADREQFPMPCLVLLDMQLPHVMGFEVLKWIRQQPGMVVPVVILTSSADDADVATAYRLGANAFLTKPSEPSVLQDMVKAISDFWLTHNALPERSYQGRAAAYSLPVRPAGTGISSTTGAHPPSPSKQTYQISTSLDL
jgi:CheY-like chemotaxis protein